MPHASFSVLSSIAAGRRLGASLLFAALALVAFVMPGAGARFQLDRASVAAGEWWRHLTCHFTHWSGEHLFWDVLMFLLLAIWCETRSRAQMLACVLGSAVLISAGVWVALPSLETYRGLSGIDSALFVLLVIDLLRAASGRRETSVVSILLVCLAAFCAKVVYEIACGQTLIVDPSASYMIPVPLAHLIGGGVGALVAAIACCTTPVPFQISDELHVRTQKKWQEPLIAPPEKGS